MYYISEILGKNMFSNAYLLTRNKITLECNGERVYIQLI